MSNKVFFQGFVKGDAGAGGGALMWQVLRRHVAPSGASVDPVRISYGDGGVDVHLSDDSMMVTAVDGDEPWELLLAGAQAAGWVILPVGRPACIVAEAQRAHLPEDLRATAIVVRTGDQLRRIVLDL